MNLRIYSGGVGIFAIANFIDPNTGNMNGVKGIVTSIIVGCIVTFILTLIIYKDKEMNSKKIESIKEENSNIGEKTFSDIKEKNSVTKLYAPIEGKLINLSDIDDPVFSSGALGKGVAIMPNIGEVRAPFDGKVIMVPDSKHAIALLSEDGVEVLIHVGMNTVELNGLYYDVLVSLEDTVKKGQLLMKFDKESIIKKGYEIITPVVITNCSEFNSTNILDKTSDVNENDIILEIVH